MLADALTKALVHCPSLLAAMNARLYVFVALRACANSQNGNWISADSVSRIELWKVWSVHSWNPLKNAVSEIDIFVFLNKRLQHHHSGSHEVNENI